MTFVKAHESELQDTWQVYFQAMIQMKADVYLYSTLENEVVESTHLMPVKDLDGLVANEEKTHQYSDPPLRRVRRSFEFPQLNRRGVYSVAKHSPPTAWMRPPAARPCANVHVVFFLV